MSTVVALGPIGFRPPRNAGSHSMPPWDSSIEASAPYWWMASAHSVSEATTPGSSSGICLGCDLPVGVCTMLSPMVTTAAPPLAFSR